MQPTTLRVLVGVLGALTLTGCIPAGINSPVQSSGATGVAFPDVVGIDLEGEQVSLPGGFAGRRNLVAVAFERDQQAGVVARHFMPDEPFSFVYVHHPYVGIVEDQ
ncbi:MAG: hypothetical protein OSB03_04200 [Vicinamibacterales bacterium]|nr:hypothetical protein [Vicinamibacterales bacterium]